MWFRSSIPSAETTSLQPSMTSALSTKNSQREYMLAKLSSLAECLPLVTKHFRIYRSFLLLGFQITARYHCTRPPDCWDDMMLGRRTNHSEGPQKGGLPPTAVGCHAAAPASSTGQNIGHPTAVGSCAVCGSKHPLEGADGVLVKSDHVVYILRYKRVITENQSTSITWCTCRGTEPCLS